MRLLPTRLSIGEEEEEEAAFSSRTRRFRTNMSYLYAECGNARGEGENVGDQLHAAMLVDEA